MKKILLSMTLLLGLMHSSQAMAADFEMEVVFEDALYGAAIGAMVGAGAMLLTTDPLGNYNYIARGTGIGVILGAAYGVATTSGALASYEDGKVRVAMPTPKFSMHGSDVAMRMDVFNSRF